MDTPPRNFALTGAAGYIAPRHLQAIHDTGQRLVAALDPSDSVGILDRFFPQARFFVDFERFDRHAEKLRRMATEQRIDIVSICSPNYLHDAHIRFALRIRADALCEKPLVLNPWNLDALEELEAEYERRVYTVLQLRLHPAIMDLRERVAAEPADLVHDIDLTYITSRGPWYFVSWKGDESRSGGIGTNIGIHFFDMLAWVFGPLRDQRVHVAKPDKMAGLLELKRARVRWFLSLDRADLPAEAGGKTTFRSLTLDGKAIEFSEGFADLHTACYRELLAGRGFGIRDTRPSIEMAHRIRTSHAVGLTGDFHPRARTAR